MRLLHVKGDDGKTPYQRERATKGPQRPLAYGDVCKYKRRAQEGRTAGTRCRWSTGVWLGFMRRAGKFIIFDKAMGGTRHALTIIRMPQPQKLSVETVRERSATPLLFKFG